MGRTFSNRAELHRTFTLPLVGAKYTKKKDERLDEAYRLVYFQGGSKKMIRLTLFSALMERGNAFSPVEITEAWDEHNFYQYATSWETKRSVLCTQASVLSNTAVTSGGPQQSFTPIVEDRGNSDVLVVGHRGHALGSDLVVPESLAAGSGGRPEDAMARGVSVYVTDVSYASRAPEGWETLGFTYDRYEVVTKPDGRVTSLRKVSSREGVESANWVIDLVIAPATLALARSGTVMVRSLMERLPIRPGPKVLAGPTSALAAEELAELSAARAAGRTMTGMAVSTRGVLPVEHLGRRTLIMGEDISEFRGLMARSHSESGLYDVVVHGDSTSFQILVKTKPNGEAVWREVSVREVADAIRPRLAAGDQIRLLACDAGSTGGPAQQLANELNRTVWASSTKLPAVPKATNGVARKSFVPKDGGRFYEFVPAGR